MKTLLFLFIPFCLSSQATLISKKTETKGYYQITKPYLIFYDTCQYSKIDTATLQYIQLEPCCAVRIKNGKVKQGFDSLTIKYFKI